MCAVKRGFIFNSVQLRKAKRNPFNLSYENKLSCNMGKIYPFFINDVLPNDTFKIGQEYLMRAQPLIAPLMHRVDIYQHYFYTPYRLVWSNFEKFITGGESGNETPEMPYLNPQEVFGVYLQETVARLYGTWTNNPSYPAKGFDYDNFITALNHYNDRLSLFDYLGYPLHKNMGVTMTNGVVPDPQSGEDVQVVLYTFDPTVFGDFVKLSSLRLRSYVFVWDNYFRDQNLTSELFTDEWKNNDGDDVVFIRKYFNDVDFNSLSPLLPRPWKKDYFTSALPFQQRGPEVLIPNRSVLTLDNTKQQKVVATNGATTLNSGTLTSSQISGPHDLNLSNPDSAPFVQNVNIDPNGSLVNDVSISINELRRANALQRWFEKNARAGARYVEQVLGHFGIRPKDYRLDRPEYLGGGKQPFTIKDVVQTSGTLEDSTPQATQAGKGTASNAQYIFKQTFEEHGLIIGLLSVMPRASYQQGIDRHLQKFDKFDWAFPEFGNLGEQEVLNKEIYFGGNAQDDEVFGYQSRYAEYKYNQDQVHGDLRDSLNYWHMGRLFKNRPLLNSSFIYGKPRKDVFAVVDQNEDCLIFDFYNHCEVLRCLPAYGTPAL